MKKLVWAVLLAGCGEGTLALDESPDDLLEVSEGPLLGANGKDAADRDCNVVLRSLSRVPNGPGFQTKCAAGSSCAVIWAGVIDVSAQAVAEGAKPSVMWKNQDARSWTQVAAKKSTGAPQGFIRYTVRLEKNTMSDGLSATALSRARIDVAAFIRLPTGARLFDKQRGQSDFENFSLTQAGGWVVAEAPAVCAPPSEPASLAFTVGAAPVQRGVLVASGRAVITYALERSPTCRGTHNGHPAWDIEATVRFAPGGEVVSGSVRGFNNPGGTPSNASAIAVPFSFAIPKGARSAEVWFRNFSGAGSSCVAWDSNFGANYRFEVKAAPYAPVQWVGRPGASTSRSCARSEGVPGVITLDSYLNERACVWVEADVYVPGLTDAVLEPHAVLAETQSWLDGVAQPVKSAVFVGRVGNDYRYRFDLPKSELFYGPKWSRFEYALRFSTDGRTWRADERRAVEREASFCNPAWVSCTR